MSNMEKYDVLTPQKTDRSIIKKKTFSDYQDTHANKKHKTEVIVKPKLNALSTQKNVLNEIRINLKKVRLT